MKITFYSAMNPKRLLKKTPFNTLADTVSILSTPGEALEIDAQQEQSYNNIIEVFRSLKLTGKLNATFELHNNINVIIDNATINSGTMNQLGMGQTGTIILASDFTGSLTILNSTIKYTGGMPKRMAIWRAASDDMQVAPCFTQNLHIANSSIDGIVDNPFNILLQGKIGLYSSSYDAKTWLASSNWQASQATINAKYAEFYNENDQQEAQVQDITCLAGPVSVIGRWQFKQMKLNLHEAAETFKFGDPHRISQIKLHDFSKIKAPVGSSAFYCNNVLLDLTNSNLGQQDDHLNATTQDSKIIMNHTVDNFNWHLEGVNVLKLDQSSVTSLRQRQNEFAQELPQKEVAAQDTTGKVDSAASDKHEAEAVGSDKTALKPPTIANPKSDTKTSETKDKEKPKDDAMQQLQAMIGLKEVKKKIHDYIELAKFNVKAKKRGLKTADDMNRHMIFGGNPGTGKTTVAKYVAQILYDNGALPTNKYKDVLASDLLKGYKSQTAGNTHEIVNEAVGGVLLIDEAYKLGDTENTFSDDAVTQLLKEIETHHDDLIIIMAGYTDDMHKFMKTTNQGFASRFNHWIDFPDYTNKEKVQIFKKMCHDGGVTCPDKIIASKPFKQLMFKFYARDHANARDVRNFYQDLTQARINRVNPEMDKLTDEEIMTFTAQDLKVVYQDAVKTLKQEKASRKRLAAKKQREMLGLVQKQESELLDSNYYDNETDSSSKNNLEGKQNHG